MTPTQYRATLHRLTLSPTTAAALCGQDARTHRRYAQGERAVPPPVVRLLALMERLPEARVVLEITQNGSSK